MKDLRKRDKKILEMLGWSYNVYEDGTVEVSQYSPAGEDFSFCVDIGGFVQNVYDYYEYFDTEEHVAMWFEARRNKFPGVPSLDVLLSDANAIEEMLYKLAQALMCAQKGEEE